MASSLGQVGLQGGLEPRNQSTPEQRPRRIFSRLHLCATPPNEGIFREVCMTQPERSVDHSVEERSLSLFKSERTEDLAAIGLAALLVLAVLFGVRL